MPLPIPDTVRGVWARKRYAQVNDTRRDLKHVATAVGRIRGEVMSSSDVPDDPEVAANLAIVYRHIEDASMRCGKVLQALDGGVSVYDKETVVDTPASPIGRPTEELVNMEPLAKESVAALEWRPQRDPIMQFFRYDHLRADIAAVSKPFCELAEKIHAELPRNPERSVALRKLKEAKDAACCAFLFVNE